MTALAVALAWLIAGLVVARIVGNDKQKNEDEDES